MARRRKSRSFGAVKHSGKKIKALYWKRYHAGASQYGRKLSIKVRIERAARPTNAGRTGGYYADACIARQRGTGKCGASMFGRTPTAALKAALKSLSQNIG